MGYVILGLVIIGLLAFDLLSHRKATEVSIKSATLWSIFYIGAALGFAVYLNFAYSTEFAQLFLTGYALEKTLAVDNLFAFMMIFSYFAVPSKYQHNILYWGIIGALVFRGIFVVLGTGFTSLFGPWASLIFAAIIGWTAYKMITSDDGDEEVDYNNAWYVKYLKKFIPVTGEQPEGKLFTRINGKLAATPFFICLVAIEMSDVVFSFDSVPAVIAVSKEPYIIYSAMIFAILGLRSLYFVLEAMKNSLSRLETAVVVILGYIALKLGIQAVGDLTGNEWHINPALSLGIILTLLAGGIITSIFFPKKESPTLLT